MSLCFLPLMFETNENMCCVAGFVCFYVSLWSNAHLPLSYLSLFSSFIVEQQSKKKNRVEEPCCWLWARMTPRVCASPAAIVPQM